MFKDILKKIRIKSPVHAMEITDEAKRRDEVLSKITIPELLEILTDEKKCDYYGEKNILIEVLRKLNEKIS